MTGYVHFRPGFWKFRNICLVTAIGNWTVVFVPHNNIIVDTIYQKRIWTNLNSLHPKILCAKFGEKNIFFKISSMYFCYFVIISPWKRVGSFIWTNLNPLIPRMLCTKFCWNWSCGSGKEDKNLKGLQQRQRRWQRRNCDKKSLRLRWPKTVKAIFREQWSCQCDNVVFSRYVLIYRKHTCVVLQNSNSHNHFVIYWL